jgi:predicted metal-dependent phosphoesterase TrpH
MPRRALLVVLVALAASAVAPAGASAAPAWLAGDLHVHSCDSDDAYCGPSDEPIAYEPGDDLGNLEELGGQITTLGVATNDRFSEASQRGLDYLAITDHNDLRSVARPGFGGAGVIGIPGYESSLRGHAQIIGAERLLPGGDQSPEAVAAIASALRADGGVFQINHPGYRSGEALERCENADKLNWRYGLRLAPDAVEVLNPTAAVAVAERFAECLLAQGMRFALTGGSDSHFAALTPVQGVGSPTTWVLADERSRAGVLGAVRAGRVSVSRRSPIQGGGPLLIEADPERDGSFANALGAEVPGGAPMRVRSLGAASAGFVDVRANGKPLLSDRPLAPGGSVTFAAPASGWVRAVLFSGAGIDLENAPAASRPASPPAHARTTRRSWRCPPRRTCAPPRMRARVRSP